MVLVTSNFHSNSVFDDDDGSRPDSYFVVAKYVEQNLRNVRLAASRAKSQLLLHFNCGSVAGCCSLEKINDEKS